MLKRVHRWVHHPSVNLAVGAMMVACAVAEIVGETISHLLGFELEAEHGLLVLGVESTVKALPELAEGVKKIERPGSSERPSASP